MHLVLFQTLDSLEQGPKTLFPSWRNIQEALPTTITRSKASETKKSVKSCFRSLPLNLILFCLCTDVRFTIEKINNKTIIAKNAEHCKKISKEHDIVTSTQNHTKSVSIFVFALGRYFVERYQPCKQYVGICVNMMDNFVNKRTCYVFYHGLL